MNHKTLLCFVPVVALGLLLLLGDAPPAPAPLSPFSPRAVPDQGGRPVDQPGASERTAVRTLYDLQPGETVALECRLHSLTTLRPEGDAPAQQVTVEVTGRGELHCLARRAGEWVASFTLVAPVIGLAADQRRGDASALARGLDLPVIVRFGPAAELLGYRFPTGMGPNQRNVLRALFSGLRAPIGRDGAFRGEEGDAGGVATVHATRSDATGLTWQRRGYPGSPGLLGEGHGHVEADSSWFARTTYREARELRTPHLPALIQSVVTVGSRLLGITTGTAAGPFDWQLPWAQASGETEAAAASEVVERERWQRDTATLTFTDAVAALAALVAAGEEHTVAAQQAAERLVWLLRLRPETVVELGVRLRDPRLEPALAALLAGAAGAAATPAAQQELLAAVHCQDLSLGRRNGAVVALVQVESPAAATLGALRAIGDAADHDPLLRGTSLMVLGAMASRSGAAPDLLAQLLAFEPVAVRDGLLEPWFDALGNTGSPQVLPVAERHLQDPREVVREAALLALRADGRPAATELLLRHADDQAANVRAVAVRQLVGRSDPRVLPVVERAMADADEGVRRAVVLGLGANPSLAGGRLLLERIAAGDPVPGVRALARELLGS